MIGTRPALTACLLLSMTFAGCAGGTDGSTEDAQAQAVVSTDQDAAVGTVTGTVSDDELLPVRAADVSLDGEISVRTATNGSFRFDAVPVGTHRIFVQRLGYESAVKQFEVARDQVVVVDLTLSAIEIATPYHLSFSANGRIACSYYLTVQWSSCPYGSTVFGEHNFCLTFPAAAGNTWRQAELVWEQNNELAPDRLWMGERDPKGNAVWGDTGQGASPLFIQSDIPYKTAEGKESESTWCVYIASSTGANIAIEQDFDIHYTAFYHMDEIPDGFSAAPIE